MTNGKLIVFDVNILAKQFSKLLQKPYSLKWTKKENQTVSMLDSFDGRLFQTGYTVKHVGDKLFFKSFKNYEQDFSAPSPQKEPPFFARDIKSENTQRFLLKLLGVRALLKRISLSLKVKSFNIINSEQKTIAQGEFIICNPEQPLQEPEKTFCIIAPLRGYAKELDKASKDWPAGSIHNNFDRGILVIYNIDLVNYSKPRFLFTENMPVSEAFKTILKESFEIMRKNEKGIIEDIDIEFLHDYRVSGRRMRSALSLIRNIISPQMSAVLINDLKQIGTVSGPLRDLDIYLLREDEYKELVPEGGSSKELRSIFVTLKTRRRRALKNMIDLLISDNYQDMVSRWNNFFNNYNRYLENDKPLFRTASSLIFKRYKRVIKEGSVLSPQHLDEGFHNLRIDCKKLRYLLEFFSSIYPKDEILLAIKQLKSLQENLGDFNDLSVQIETLKKILANAAKKNKTALIQDISGLIAVLSFKKQQLRNKFQSLFTDFGSTKNRKLFEGMFLKEPG